MLLPYTDVPLKHLEHPKAWDEPKQTNYLSARMQQRRQLHIKYKDKIEGLPVCGHKNCSLAKVFMFFELQLALKSV